MKTENHETLTTTNSEPAAFNRHAAFTSTHLTSGLSRLSTACLNKLNELKERLSAQLAAEYGVSINHALLRQAINEADALAATTPFPSLFLPTLAEEKVQLAYVWNSRQRAIREQTWALAA
jgi:hypothetical protein